MFSKWGPVKNRYFRRMAHPIVLVASFSVLTIGGTVGFAQLHSATAGVPDVAQILADRPTAIAATPKIDAPVDERIALLAAPVAPQASTAPVQLAQNLSFGEVQGDAYTYDDSSFQTFDDSPSFDDANDGGKDDGRGNYDNADAGYDSIGDGSADIVTMPVAVAPPVRAPLFSRSGDTPAVARRQIRPVWSVGVYR